MAERILTDFLQINRQCTDAGAFDRMAGPHIFRCHTKSDPKIPVSDRFAHHLLVCDQNYQMVFCRQ